ncbi:MAG: DoxX family protein [Ectothiorhodospiraceae bacterium]|nr:DoxX family protein [Ectothiorhodospiraceae bacterium]MCH8503396.1 DoxX family protein [Ectothiorhodospiraceae bacterium]
MMSATNRTVFDGPKSSRPRLFFPFLAQFYTRGEPITYALLRIAFGLSILTHGIPKLLGLPHGSMADPMAGTTHLIGNVLGLPFAPQLAIFVALLETFGAIAIAIGLGTRLLGLMFTVQMIVICFAIGPTYPWIDRGIEYPIMLGFVSLLLAVRGGGRYSVDRRLGVEL